MKYASLFLAKVRFLLSEMFTHTVYTASFNLQQLNRTPGWKWHLAIVVFNVYKNYYLIVPF